MKNSQKLAPVNGHVKNCFGVGLEIVDAKKPLTLLPSAADFENAVRRDPHKCGFAQTCARLLNSSRVLFFKNSVYIDHVGEDGIRRVYRYTPSSGVRKTIEAFDEGRLTSSQVIRAFELRPPSFSMTLIEMRRQNKHWRTSNAGRSILSVRKSQRRVNGLTRDLDNMKERLVKLETKLPPAAPLVVETRTQVRKLRQRLSDAIDEHRSTEKIADGMRTVPSHKASPAKPKQHAGAHHARDGRFFWNTAKVAAYKMAQVQQ